MTSLDFRCCSELHEHSGHGKYFNYPSLRFMQALTAFRSRFTDICGVGWESCSFRRLACTLRTSSYAPSASNIRSPDSEWHPMGSAPCYRFHIWSMFWKLIHWLWAVVELATEPCGRQQSGDYILSQFPSLQLLMHAYVCIRAQIAWFSIGLASWRFRRAWTLQGRSLSDLKYTAKWTWYWGPPFVVITVTAIILSVSVNGSSLCVSCLTPLVCLPV